MENIHLPMLCDSCHSGKEYFWEEVNTTAGKKEKEKDLEIYWESFFFHSTETHQFNQTHDNKINVCFSQINI